MVTQRDVLMFLAERTEHGKSFSYEDLVHEFSLSEEGICGHLGRLWRDRLIEAIIVRPSRFRFRLQPGESLRTLRFRLAPRGQERLRWYERQDEKESEGFPWFR